MTTQFNTAFDVHVDIYNTKKLYDKKKEEYNKLLELNQTYHNEEKNCYLSCEGLEKYDQLSEY